MTIVDISWKEFRLHLSEPPEWTEHYRFIRDNLIPYVNRNTAQRFFILNYRDSERDMIRFRIEASESGFENARSFLSDLVSNREISRFEEENWNPRTDALNRIESARLAIEAGFEGREIPQGWMVDGKSEGSWIVSESDYDMKADQLTFMFKEVIGAMTRVFYETFEEKPMDMWIMSVFLHLLINSLDYSGPGLESEEAFIREFPPY